MVCAPGVAANFCDYLKSGLSGLIERIAEAVLEGLELWQERFRRHLGSVFWSG